MRRNIIIHNDINEVIDLDTVKGIARKYSMPYLDTKKYEWEEGNGKISMICDIPLAHLENCLKTIKRNNTEKYLKNYPYHIKRELGKMNIDKEKVSEGVEYILSATKNLLNDKIIEVEDEIRRRD